jgi:hypothetical protein
MGATELMMCRWRIPESHIFIDEHRRNNIPVFSSATTSTSEPIDLVIVALRSTGGSLAYEDRSQGNSVRFPVWDLSAVGNEQTGIEEVQFQTRKASEIRYGATNLTINNIDVKAAIDLRHRALNLHSAQLANGLGDTDVHGTVTNFNDPLLDLALAGIFI